MHPRQTIRNAVVSAVTGLHTTGVNVSANRVVPYSILPALNVTTLNESIDVGSCAMGTDPMVRELKLVIEGRCSASTTPNDQLDTIADEVEIAVMNDAVVKSLTHDVVLQSTAFSFNGDGADSIGKIEMQFLCLYQA